MIIRPYVQVKASGKYVRRLLNLCITNDIYLWNIESNDLDEMLFCCYSSDYLKMKKIIQKTHSKTKIQSKKGLIQFFKKRFFVWLLCVSVIIFILIQTAINQRVWDIQIRGNNDISDAEVCYFLEKDNIYKGCQKRKSYDKVEKNIINEYDCIVWCTVYLENNVLMVEVSEGINIER